MSAAGDARGGCHCGAVRFVVLAGRVGTSTAALPTNEYSASFIAAYSRFAEPQIAIRKYFGMIAIS